MMKQSKTYPTKNNKKIKTSIQTSEANIITSHGCRPSGEGRKRDLTKSLIQWYIIVFTNFLLFGITDFIFPSPILQELSSRVPSTTAAGYGMSSTRNSVVFSKFLLAGVTVATVGGLRIATTVPCKWIGLLCGVMIGSMRISPNLFSVWVSRRCKEGFVGGLYL